MGRLPSYRDFTPLLGTTRLRAIPYSPSFELSRQKNPQPADSLRRSEKKRPSEGSRRMALSDPKMFARPEYVPLWNSESNVWRSGFAGFLSPLAKSVANPMRGRQRTDEKEYQLSAATRHAQSTVRNAPSLAATVPMEGSFLYSRFCQVPVGCPPFSFVAMQGAVVCLQTQSL